MWKHTISVKCVEKPQQMDLHTCFGTFRNQMRQKNTSQAKCTERVQNLSKSDLFRNLLGCILKDFQIVWGVELSDRHQRFFVDFDGARWLSMIHTFQNISLNFSVASDVRSLFQRHSSMVWYVGVFDLPGMRGGKFCAFLKEGFLYVRDGCFPHALNDRQWSQMLLSVWKVLSIPTVFLVIFTAFLCCRWLKADFSRKTLKYIETTGGPLSRLGDCRIIS